MCDCISRRTFLGSSVVGATAIGLAASAAAGTPAPNPPTATRAKVRIGKVYFGREHPGWPKDTVDVPAEHRRFEEEFAKRLPKMADVEFVDCGLVTTAAELAAAREKLSGADGILVLQLTMGLGGILAGLLDLNLPTVLFAEPYCGHEWHTIASLQRQGKRIDCWASSQFDDLVTAVRPLRAIGKLKADKLLHISLSPADPKYVALVQEKFGTQIKSLGVEDLEKAYQAVDAAAAEAEAQGWVKGAKKVVEPSPDDILKAARMSVALQNLIRSENAAAVTINCLGMNLIGRGLGYPCLGFSRLNSIGSGGICEADLKSSMTHLIFQHLVGRPGFVTDPCFDYSNNTIIHAHCVSAVKMLGAEGPEHPYIIRSHLEDNRGAVLQVQLPVGQPISMARLIGNDLMLFSTGEAIDSPLVDRGCRTKLTVRVPHPEKFMEGWSCGLHRVIFYGDHARDIDRFCRLMQIRVIREGTDDVRDIPGLTWAPRVHA